eukprot:CAMPEP_0174331512 /NCGR_PEP_ID=MMETSP0810-20121108/17539_1 /TAXON_ID=73025 ORGANISM="Eutreptiella gymnastica-like, Strain CCMP1594" /NCGR_SAMPLE_ID=MMETSP0810 /ASSEMBLY_ACC=CAM_ASM_000659 /LENGTH=521 /DNA_ID=CAMNT_0015447329 /DNA_START=26 /DNA_END=1591 /DNA_ORIENTATION=+
MYSYPQYPVEERDPLISGYGGGYPSRYSPAMPYGSPYGMVDMDPMLSSPPAATFYSDTGVDMDPMLSRPLQDDWYPGGYDMYNPYDLPPPTFPTLMPPGHREMHIDEFLRAVGSKSARNLPKKREVLVLPAGDAEPIQDPKELDRPPSEPGYKSPYTHRNYQAPLVPDNKSLTPLNQISLMSNQWKQSSGGHPIGSERKKQKRVNTVQAMYKEYATANSRAGKDSKDRGLFGSLAGQLLGGFLDRLMQGGSGPSNAPPLLPPGPIAEWTPITGTRRALLIGINYTGQKGQLRGCANDVKQIAAFLKGRGFDSIQMLVDDGSGQGIPPTKTNILAGFRWLLNGARGGDSLFWHYSGHGSTQRDRNNDEWDTKDETICPLDYAKAGMLVDDEIYDALVKPLPMGCRLTALMDCCHSGTGMDLPYIKQAKAGSGLQCEYRDLNVLGDAILYSGCKDTQTSADVMVGDQGYGAMTNAFLKAMSQNEMQSYESLLASIRNILHGKYTQIPQLSMSKNLNLAVPFQV